MLSYDNFIEYIQVCKELNLEPLGIKDDFYKHLDEIDKNITDLDLKIKIARILKNKSGYRG